MSNQTLIIFTRYPEIGKTKTRLIPALGAKGAADFQRYLTEETITKAQKLSQKIPLNIEIHFSGGNEELMKKWLGDEFIFKKQIGKDLGEKMLNSFNSILSKRKDQVIIIGIDCLELNENILEEAFKAFTNFDLVIGKAHDGGYYLIGLKNTIPELFNNIQWGTATVFESTKNIANSLELKIWELPILNDIDTPEDLKLLASANKKIDEHTFRER